MATSVYTCHFHLVRQITWYILHSSNKDLSVSVTLRYEKKARLLYFVTECSELSISYTYNNITCSIQASTTRKDSSACGGSYHCHRYSFNWHHLVYQEKEEIPPGQRSTNEWR